MIRKLAKHRSVQQTSTVAGQREELREQRNKINELVEQVDWCTTTLLVLLQTK